MNKRLVILILIVLLMFPALEILSPVGAQEEPRPEAVGLRPDAPPYALHGPYWVGTREFVIDPEGERPILLRVWYPALNPEGIAESITYEVQWKLPIPAVSDMVVMGHALNNALSDETGAPYPLVIFSHGFAAWLSAYAYIPEHIASYGFVVISPDHQESLDAGFTYDELWESSIERPQDIRRVLDYAETLTGQAGDMEQMIDMEHVAIAGHSTGGYTALAAAGARYDLAGFNERCDAARALGDPNAWLCDPFASRETDMAVLAGVDPNLEGLWPSMGDPRVDAVIPMAGDSYLFDEAGLAEITIPIMAMGGTIDTGTPFEWGARPAYDNASSAHKILVALENAEHVVFLTKCADDPFLLELGISAFCADPVWDMDRAHDLINHFVVAFLLAELKGDADAAAALAPDAVSFPGITYEATGF
jgi:predicted dienelactone hydrolase